MENDMNKQAPANPDLRNRKIAQEAQTDTELESQVPPRSPTGLWWRILLAAAAIVLVSLLIMAV